MGCSVEDSPTRLRTGTMERRRAPDGELYTKSQFEEWFGGLEEWAAAAPQREQQPQQQQQRRSRQQQREQQRPPQPEEKPAEPAARPRRVLAAGSPLFQQVVAIQRDRQSFAAVCRVAVACAWRVPALPPSNGTGGISNGPSSNPFPMVALRPPPTGGSRRQEAHQAVAINEPVGAGPGARCQSRGRSSRRCP